MTAAAADDELHASLLQEPYDACKANTLRRECYRRGLRPIKFGPGMNNHKAGFMALLRAHDTRTNATCPLEVVTPPSLPPASLTDSGAADSSVDEPLTKKRKLPRVRALARICAEQEALSPTAVSDAASAMIAAEVQAAVLSSPLSTASPSPSLSPSKPQRSANDHDEAPILATNPLDQQQQQHQNTRAQSPVERAKAALYQTQCSMLERQQLTSEHRDLVASVAQVQSAIARVKATERSGVAATAVLADLQLDLEFMLRQKRLIRARLDEYFESAEARKRAHAA